MGGIYTVQLAAGAVAGIEQPFVPENFKVMIIYLGSPALGGRFPVKVQSQPAQILAQYLGKFPAGAHGIQILHPQNHLPAPGADGQPGHQCRKYIAQMHPPGGGGGKAAYRCYSIHAAHQMAMAAMAMSSQIARITRNRFCRLFFFLAFL